VRALPAAAASASNGSMPPAPCAPACALRRPRLARPPPLRRACACKQQAGGRKRARNCVACLQNRRRAPPALRWK
jgi:hypothetical protein